MAKKYKHSREFRWSDYMANSIEQLTHALNNILYGVKDLVEIAPGEFADPERLKKDRNLYNITDSDNINFEALKESLKPGEWNMDSLIGQHMQIKIKSDYKWVDNLNKLT